MGTHVVAADAQLMLPTIADSSVDVVVTDPPYDLLAASRNGSRRINKDTSANPYSRHDRGNEMSRHRVEQAECLDHLATLAAESMDAVVTDPPYDLTTAKRYGPGQQPTQGPPQFKRMTGGFMGQSWDATGIAFRVELWQQVLRVLKPGGHLLAFGGTRTNHRMVCAIEDAGFEIRDSLYWVHGQGFPKSLDCTTAIRDSAVQALRRDVGRWTNSTEDSTESYSDRCRRCGGQLPDAEGTDPGGEPRRDGALARSHPSWPLVQTLLGSARKGTVSSDEQFGPPSMPDSPGRKDGAAAQLLQVIAACLCRSCFAQSVALASDCAAMPDDTGLSRSGALPVVEFWATSRKWLDSVHIAPEPYNHYIRALQQWAGWGTALKPAIEPIAMARKPLKGTVAANVEKYGTGALNLDGGRIGDDARVSGGMSHLGVMHDDDWVPKTIQEKEVHGRWPANVLLDEDAAAELDDVTQGASRFFYCAKASREEREFGLESLGTRTRHRVNPGGLENEPRWAPTQVKNHHPTVKPVALMRWLCRLVTPPGGLVLDPFCGSGTTGVACRIEEFGFLGIEREPEYVEIAQARIAGALGPLFVEAPP